ncbi:hypothetical protein [Aeropyrum pernix]|uniref:hypothetical protein n=1 Tax=Aeropyrum pernix TaxID=56636 RepID=UPI000005DC72|nr:hypothetical protein [Aeropyrum pernix]
MASLALVALLLAQAILYAVPVKASGLTLTDVQNAIDLGVQAVLDAIRPVDVNGSTYYVMPDYPSPTIMVKYNGELYVPGSFLDPGDKYYKTELVGVTNNMVAWRYYFNVDSDSDYDIVIYASLTNVDYNTDELLVYVDESEYQFDLALGTRGSYWYYGVTQGWSTTKTIYEGNDYKFHSARYVLRHSTIIAAWLLEDEGYSYYPRKMKELWDNVVDFNYDVYAPLFGRSKTYPDSFFDYRYSTWLSWNGYEGHPWQVGDYLVNYPYKSRIYILDSLGLFNEAISGWKEFPLHKLLRAMHLLDKYGASAQSEAEQLIAEAIIEGGWDGYGLKKANVYGLSWSYKGYPVYLNATLLAALVKYYDTTGDRWVAGNDILYMADRLAGILVRLQWDYEHDTPWGPVRLALFRGWWPAAYDIGSLVSKPSAWGILDTFTSGLDSVTGVLATLGYDVGEALRPMPSEWPFAVVNSESTILAVQALKLYLDLAQRLGRSPLDPLQEPKALWSGELVETGGDSTGFLSLTSYYADYGVSGDGWLLRVAAFSDIYEDAWAYAYSKVRLNAPASGSYTLRILMMVYYYGVDSYGNTGYVIAVVKLYDPSGNLIKHVEDTVVTIEKDLPPGMEGVKTLSFELNNLQLGAGDYYVEVGLKALADASLLQVSGVFVKAYGVIESISLQPS